MNITFAPRNTLQIDDARLIYRNFSGSQTKYNREGDRNFAIIIPNQEIADKLTENGWNVTVKPPREEGEDPFMYLKVKVKYNDWGGPNAYLWSGNRRTALNESTISRLDRIDILTANLDLAPHNWDVNGRTGRSAYLDSIEVYQRINRFEERYSEEEYPEE